MGSIWHLTSHHGLRGEPREALEVKGVCKREKKDTVSARVQLFGRWSSSKIARKQAQESRRRVWTFRGYNF